MSLVIEKKNLPEFEKKNAVYKKPADFINNTKKINMKDENFKIIKLVQGEDIVFMPKTTYDKQNLTVDTLEHGWAKDDLNEFMRKEFNPNKDDYYKIYMLTTQGWMSGKLYRGDKIDSFCNYSNIIDSDRNYVDKNDEMIYAIHVQKIPRPKQ